MDVFLRYKGVILLGKYLTEKELKLAPKCTNVKSSNPMAIQSSRKLRLYLVYIYMLLLGKTHTKKKKKAMAKTITVKLKLFFRLNKFLKW